MAAGYRTIAIILLVLGLLLLSASIAAWTVCSNGNKNSRIIGFVFLFIAIVSGVLCWYFFKK